MEVPIHRLGTTTAGDVTVHQAGNNASRASQPVSATCVYGNPRLVGAFAARRAPGDMDGVCERGSLELDCRGMRGSLIKLMGCLYRHASTKYASAKEKSHHDMGLDSRIVQQILL